MTYKFLYSAHCTNETLRLEHSVVQCRNLGNSEEIRITLKLLKCVAEQWWNTSVRSIVWKMKHCTDWRRKGTCYIKRRNANCIGNILRLKCLLRHVTEGKTGGKRRRGRRTKQLLNDLKERSRYRKMKEKALGITVWWTHLGRVYGTVVWENIKRINIHNTLASERSVIERRNCSVCC